MSNIAPFNRKLVATVTALSCLLVTFGEGTSVAGIQGSGRARTNSVGRITAFGSIFVNDVEYAVAGAQIRLDGRPGSETELQVGQIVTLKGDLNADGVTGSATEVSFTGDVAGPVTQVNAPKGTFVVLGQTVHVDGDTVFGENIRPADIEGVATGAAVEVSAFANASGDLVASRIDLQSGAGGLQVKGAVQALNTKASTFRINALTVSYYDVEPVGLLENGAVVIVKGSASGASGALQASSLQVSTGVEGADQELGQVEGLVTSFTSMAEFQVGDQKVATDSNTHFALRGQSLGPNLAVTVEGSFNASGVLVASKVDAKKHQDSTLARGLVDSVSAASGKMRVLGVEVAISPATGFEDQSTQHLRPFGLSDVRTGDYVEVRGLTDALGNSFTATMVKRGKPDSRWLLQGVARGLMEPNFTVLGVNVISNAGTHFMGFGGGVKKREARTLNVASGQVFEVTGTSSDGSLVADRVKLVH